jgi:flagellar motor switch protein FliN/FliY
MGMSEENIETQAQELSEGADQEEEKIGWENAIEELEEQKHEPKQGQPTASGAKESPTTEDKNASVSHTGLGRDAPNLRFVLDVPLQITVELGRKRLLIQELLQLNQGSVIELAKQVGEPFSVMVNQKLIARGEVVVVNDKFGVRITDIISPSERMQQLQ